MRTNFGIVAVGVSLLCSATGLAAHHSFAAEYDQNKPITLKGVVTKYEWTNPHARFYIDVVDEDGKVINWNIELASPSALARNGWSSRSLKVGEQTTVQGFEAKVAGTYRVNARSVVLADGRVVFSGATDDGTPAAGRQ